VKGVKQLKKYSLTYLKGILRVGRKYRTGFYVADAVTTLKRTSGDL
jgi:hypothetical protein